MSDDDRRVIGEALHALAGGPFIPDDGELKIVTGVTRGRLATLADRWPAVEDDATTWYLVGSVLAQLWGYPHRREDVWSDHLSVSKNELLALSKRLGVLGRSDRHLQRLVRERRDARYAGMSDDEVKKRLLTIDRPGINPRHRRRIVDEARRRGLPPPRNEKPDSAQDG